MSLGHAAERRPERGTRWSHTSLGKVERGACISSKSCRHCASSRESWVCPVAPHPALCSREVVTRYVPISRFHRGRNWSVKGAAYVLPALTTPRQHPGPCLELTGPGPPRACSRF